ncbi:non-ribosomal peptide synthetase [Nitrospira moscoviensis]|uniref:non-ribosomal peptide synthetase n=1 Tax=Nitrospira moscoviensis TaxID=42253 RepID=UPI001651B136|nr:non-ribosomal peptide synthetase [Nitrospira moscoviensis]
MRWRARHEPERPAYLFIKQGIEVDDRLTYGELHRRAYVLAGWLQRHARREDRALLVYGGGLDVAVAFWACLYAGIIAVPAPPPDPVSLKRRIPRLKRIAEDSDACLVLSSGAALDHVRALSADLGLPPGCRIVDTSAVSPQWAGDMAVHRSAETDLAFVQYTSGSTADPKGVMVAHGNLLVQCRDLHAAAGSTEHSRSLTWMPYFHDYGLIHGLVAPVFAGHPSYLMPALLFLKEPVRWLEAMTAHGITHSGAPNFGYEHCLRGIEPAQRTALNLARWNVASCGAEPIREATMAGFIDAYRPYGFRPEAFSPAYGMAECTLVVSLKAYGVPPTVSRLDTECLQQGRIAKAEGAGSLRAVVGCGMPIGDMQVVIVNPDTRERCAPDVVGEVWLSGGSVARGYWNRPADTDAVFRAFISGTGEGPFLRTGDLGFLQDGQLFITGRLKDLIIVHGRNHYPQDIELTVEFCHPALRPGGGAAFAVEGPLGEQLVVVQEVQRLAKPVDGENICSHIRRHVADEHELHVFEVVLIKAGSLPKTSSGKVQRRACRDAYLGDRLPIVGRSRAPGSVLREQPRAVSEPTSALPPETGEAAAAEASIRDILAEQLKVVPEQIRADAPLAAFGLDSLMVSILRNRLEQRYGVSPSFAQIMSEWTVRDLARHMVIHGRRPPADHGDSETDGLICGALRPLSANQRRIWFLEQIYPGTAMNNISVGIRLRGAIDVAALERCVAALASRHDMLRARFIGNDREVMARIEPDGMIAVERYLVEPEATDVERLFSRLAKEQVARPFDLEKGPLCRVFLATGSPTDHLLVVTAHRLIADGWSLRLFCREFTELYHAGEGIAVPVPPACAQAYAAYVDWQEAWLAGPDREVQEAYWKSRLTDLPPPVEVPADYPRVDRPGPRNSQVRNRLLPPDLASALNRFCQDHAVTKFMVGYAALAAWLWRCTGAEDAVVGSVVANRRRTRFERAFGYFVNTVALRLNAAEAGTGRELLGRVKQVVTEAYDHQDVPFETVLDAVKMRRDARRPLFNVMLVLEDDPVAELLLPGVTATALPVEVPALECDLVVMMLAGPKGTELALAYDADLFTADTATRMLAQLETVLAGMIRQPDARLSSLPLLSEQERRTVLVEWNRTQAPLSGMRCIHLEIAAQAERTPDAAAVICGSDTLTYGELNRQSDRLASVLAGMGIGRGHRAVLICERSAAGIIALLGVLKAGAAYVPLDPTWPDQRIRSMCEDANPSVIVTHRELRERVRDYGRKVLTLDALDVSHAQTVPAIERTSLDDVAYVVYTSGSTGKPKGVQISHRSLRSSLDARVRYYHEPVDRFLLTFPFAFDGSVTGIYWTLLQGGALVIPSEAAHRDPTHLRELIGRHRITHLVAVPSLYEAVLRGVSASKVASLRVVISAGETLSPQLVRRHYEVAPGAALYNEYGPTEATVWCTVYRTTPGESAARVPIGKPIPNVQVYVLDARLQPVPVGMPGELYVAGAGLALGYLNEPALTDAKFVPHPFEPQAKVYRTGDLARFRSDGNLEFLGRADHQVKLRGYRVELEEIDAVLRAYPGVDEAVAVLREDTPGQQRLVAYYTGALEQDAEGPLRTYAASRLPSYMVPALLIHVDTLPRTAAGKVDRRRLPAPHDVDSGPRPADAPSTPTEAALIQIWKEILHLPQVGVDDNFFQLGGHSLLATQVVSRVRETFRVDCPLRTVFELPTIAELADAIDRLRQEAPATAGAAVVPVPRDRPLPLSFSQQRMWFMYQLSPESTAYNMPIATRLLGPLDREAMLAAAHDMVRRHEAFRTTFSLTPDGPTQQIHGAQPVDVHDVDLRGMPMDVRVAEAARLVAEEARRPFDLHRGPLARFSLIRIDEADHILVLNMHHIIGDQWSFGVIGRECARLYNEYRRGRRPVSEHAALQYADVAVWQRRTLTDTALAGQLAYWREKLAGLPVLTLPTDYPRPQRQSFVGSYRSMELPEALLARLRTVCAEQGGTLFMGLLAAFQILLSRYSGQDDIAVGVPIANRTRRFTEDIIGTFVNTLVMRTDLSNRPSFTEAVGRVRDSALGAYAHQDLPFERLVSAVAPGRDLSHSPLVQVLFNVANAPLGRIEFDGLTWAPFEFDGGTVQFDLTMTIDTEVSRKVYLSYRTDLFTGETVERMVREYVALLEAVAADPHRTITEYDCMSPADRRRLLIEWNRTEADYPSNLSLPELITAQAARTPDAVAVAQGAHRLTYGALERRANQLAHYLRRRGARPGACVGICLERTPSLLVGALGILKSGAAYIPLDPEYPLDRLHYMLEESGAGLVVTSQALKSRLPETGREVICLDREQRTVEQESMQAPAAPEPSDLAYVLYTSGSTGKPKGVAICHRSLVNFLWSMKSVPGCSSRDRLLAVTTLSFDIAGLELYLPLIVGGTVELVDRRTATDGHALKALLKNSRSTIMQATPATWRMLIDAGWEATPDLTVLCGGEALSRDLADRILERAGSLWNMYGPTETTIWSTVSPVARGDAEITIGRPIANTQLYVLDAALRPVPIGVPGELYIGGEGLALGYHRRPDLTAERFIASPFNPAARLYKTGDLVRYRSDGHVVHLGRLDHQVKIRGFRIELGEIEAALLRHPVVRQAVVGARPDASGTKQLVAYAVLKQDAGFDVREMHTFLRRSLPDYMVPAHLVVMPQLPLTANGKVDVSALPVPDPPPRSHAGPSGRPMTPVQVQLAALWQQVLGVPDIGIHDNFFDLGGHSLKAVQLFAHLERVFGKQLPLATLFQAPTIAQLSDILTASQWEAPWRSLVAIQPAGAAPPVFAVPGVGGNVLGFAKLAQLLGPDQPFYGLQTRGLDGREAPFTSIVNMAAHYVEEIRTIQRNGPFVIAGTCTGGVVAYEMAQQLSAVHEPVILMILESWHPLSYNGYALRMKRYARPLLYGWSRALRFLGSSRRLSLSERVRLGLSNLIRRVERIGSASAAPILGEEFSNQRVAGATLEAVASYRPQEYRGRLLNVTASKRVVDDPARDTRTLWEFLARGGAESAGIPAGNSGQLFVSPHVEALADLLRDYIRKERSLRAAAHDRTVTNDRA